MLRFAWFGGWLLPLLLLPARGLAQPAFFAELAGGTTVQGSLQTLRDDGACSLGREKPTTIPAGECLRLRQVGKPLPAPPSGEQLCLVNGDRVPGKILGMTGERVQFQPDWAEAPLAVLIDHVRCLWFANPEKQEAPEVYRQKLLRSAPTKDRLVLRNGDLSEGLFTGLTAEQVVLEVNKQSVSVQRSRVACLLLANEANLKPGKQQPSKLVLANGGRLSLTNVSCTDGAKLVGAPVFGGTLSLPVGEVVSCTLSPSRTFYLSDLTPSEYVHTPYLTFAWPFRRDANLSGKPISLAGDVFDKGLSLHSESRLTYSVKDLQVKRLEARVGLDAELGRGGHVVVKVFVHSDEKTPKLAWEKTLTEPGQAVPVRVELAGMSKVTLVVEFGEGGDVSDHVLWADARLVK